MSGKKSASVKDQQRFRVLYDGWPLAYAPESPAALHLLELLSMLPEAVEACVALPVTALDGSARRLLDELSPYVTLSWPAADTLTGKLRWEQSGLSSLARAQQISLIHITTLHPPLFAPCPVVVSPAEVAAVSAAAETARADGIAGRVRSALGRGGLSAAKVVLWPEDLPIPEGKLPIQRLPPMVHKAFTKPLPRPSHLPENYVLAAGPMNEASMQLLAAAWSWTISGLGDDWTLLVSGLDQRMQAQLRGLCEESGTAETLRFATLVQPMERAAAFQSASAVILVVPVAAWGDPYLQALACARPLAAQDRSWEDARVGAAGYLTPPGDARALGAAVLTMIVEEQVGAQLGESAMRRSAAWEKSIFSQRLVQIYAEVVPSAASVLLAARQ